MSTDQTFPSARRVRRRIAAAQASAFGLATLVVAWSAIMAKEATVRGQRPEPMLQVAHAAPAQAGLIPQRSAQSHAAQRPAARGREAQQPAARPQQEWPADTRWFDGRPVRPVRTIVLRTTAYSPDAISCAPFDDGQTATLHSVETNGMALVAADTRLLPFGTLVSIPGYDNERIVPVLDRGGRIKGRRLDLLFPTHRQARAWGVQNLPVTVWEYADGKPATDPRKVR